MANKEESKFLPTHVRPLHYDLTIIPDMPAKTFHGEVAITIEVKKPTKQIKMHQKDLELNHESSIKVGDRSWQVNGTLDDNKEETVIFKFPEEVPKTDKAVLHIKWKAPLTKQMQGLYRTTYFDNKGKRHSTISTHFEPTTARRCFPCFDEPKLKATFSVRVVMEARFHVIGNTPPDTEDNILPNVYPPMREWRFQKTPMMSTYLVGFTAAEMDRVERVSKNGTLVRTWARLGHAKEAEASNEWAVKVLDHFDEYFAFPYRNALPKLDLVPVENFPIFAMENWGCIFFKPQLLLDNASTSAVERQHNKEIMAHEIAHQWFGNLVTPRFWDSLWLKEGFATYFAYQACGALEADGPHRERYLMEEVISGKALDSRASTHALEMNVGNSGEARQVFDEISYNKGAGLITMLESYIGADAVRDGLRKYIDQFKFKNAASLDLWLALGKVAKVEGPSVKDLMKAWTKQEGHPLVSVERTAAGTLTFTQKRALSKASKEEWTVPLLISTSVDPAKKTLFVLDKASATLAVDPKATWVLVNAGQNAFVCVNYAGELHTQLVANLASLSAIDQVGVLADHAELYDLGKLTLKQLLDVTSAVASSTAPAVWGYLARLFLRLLSCYDDHADKAKFQKYVRDLFAKTWASWGFKEHANDPNVVRHRSAVIKVLAFADEKSVLLGALELFEAGKQDLMAVPADIRSGVWAALVLKGFRPAVDALFTLVQQRDLRNADLKLALEVLGMSRSAGDIPKIIKLFTEGNAKGMNLRFAMDGFAQSHAAARAAAWTAVTKNWEGLIEAVGLSSTPFILKAFANGSENERQVQDFVKGLKPEQKSYVNLVAQNVTESIQTNKALKKAASAALKNL